MKEHVGKEEKEGEKQRGQEEQNVEEEQHFLLSSRFNGGKGKWRNDQNHLASFTEPIKADFNQNNTLLINVQTPDLVQSFSRCAPCSETEEM